MTELEIFLLVTCTSLLVSTGLYRALWTYEKRMADKWCKLYSDVAEKLNHDR